MVFSRTETKPAEDTTFDISSSESLKPSVLSTMDYYHGADLRPSGIEYPEGYVAPIQPSAPDAETVPEEIIEESPVQYSQDEADSIPEFTSEKVLYKNRIAYKKLAASGLRRFVKAAKNARSAVANKYYGANMVMADAVNGIHSVGDKLSKLESKTNRTKVLKGIGGLALVGAAGVGVYLSYKGISMLEASHSHHAAHEAAQQVLPSKAPQHHEAAQTIPAQPKVVHHPEVVAQAPAHPKAPAHNLPVHPKELAKHVSSKLSNYNLKDWTWDLAHRVRPGHENGVIAKALRSYQQITGNHAQLVQHGNTSFIEVNNHVVNTSQMEAINRLVVGG